jgi:hypothetical protein
MATSANNSDKAKRLGKNSAAIGATKEATMYRVRIT